MRRSRFGTAAGHGAEQHILRAGELLEVAAAAHSCGRLEVKEAGGLTRVRCATTTSREMHLSVLRSRVRVVLG